MRCHSFLRWFRHIISPFSLVVISKYIVFYDCLRGVFSPLIQTVLFSRNWFYTFEVIWHIRFFFFRFSNLSLADDPKMVMKSNRCNRCYLATLLISCLAFLAVGILIGYFVKDNTTPNDNETNPASGLTGQPRWVQ